MWPDPVQPMGSTSVLMMENLPASGILIKEALTMHKEMQVIIFVALLIQLQ